VTPLALIVGFFPRLRRLVALGWERLRRRRVPGASSSPYRSPPRSPS
jgi:hypothetical protein